MVYKIKTVAVGVQIDLTQEEIEAKSNDAMELTDDNAWDQQQYAAWFMETILALQ